MISPTHPLYVLCPTQQIVGEFLCKMFKHWPTILVDFSLPILVSPSPPKSVPTRPINVSHLTSKMYKCNNLKKIKIKKKKRKKEKKI
jgi:hypothetical protein